MTIVTEKTSKLKQSVVFNWLLGNVSHVSYYAGLVGVNISGFISGAMFKLHSQLKLGVPPISAND